MSTPPPLLRLLGWPLASGWGVFQPGSAVLHVYTTFFQKMTIFFQNPKTRKKTLENNP
jgi:hypothetical protein